MKLKSGVSIVGIRPELTLGLMIANSVYENMGHDLVVTSVMDGKHSLTSLHYTGCAADLRIRDIPQMVQAQARDKIAEALPDDFDVILEKDHIHLEFQPRRRV